MSKDRELGPESPLATRRSALGMTAAMTAGLLADRALSPDAAHAEGVTSVNGKMGVVVLTASNVEAVPASEVGKPNGVATLNSSGVLPESQLATSVVSSSEIRLVVAPTGVAATDTANIQNMMNVGPGTVQLQAGTYICNLLTLPTGVTLVGRGRGVTIIRLASSSKTDLLHSENWETLHGTGETVKGGVTNCGWRDLTFDGNRFGGGTTAPSKLSGLVSIFGWAFNCTRFDVINAPGNALVSEWNNAEDVLMEAWVSDFKIHESKEIGLLWNGPHDSIVKDAQIVNSGTVGIMTSGHGNATTFDKVHSWGGAGEWNWILGVEAYLLECQGEDAKTGALWIKHNDSHILGGQFFDSPIGIRLGEVGKEIAGCTINTRIFQCSTTAFEISGNDFKGAYDLVITPEKETAESVLKGSVSETSTVKVIPTNEQQVKIQYPNKSLIALGEGSTISFEQGPGNIGVVNDHLGFFGATPIAKPAAITAPAETTKANTEAIKSLITVLKNLGLTS